MKTSQVKSIECVGLNRYFALELYDATIEQFVTNRYKGRMPSDAQVLYQMAKGIKYLHDHDLKHGNINPRTILIAQSQPLKMMIKVSEFGLSKFVDYNSQYSYIHQTKSNRTIETLSKPEYWRLPDDIHQTKSNRTIEKLSKPEFWGLTDEENSEEEDDDEEDQDYKEETVEEEEPNGTTEGDEFAAGCMFFYFVKRGLHLFGNADCILENIKKSQPVNLDGILCVVDSFFLS